MIYEKRRALIEYVAFYSTALTHAPATENVGHLTRLGRTELPCGVTKATVDVDGVVNRHDGHSGSSSPVSGGSSSPPSECGTSSGSDDETADVVPVTYESVKRERDVRDGVKPAQTQSGLFLYR